MASTKPKKKNPRLASGRKRVRQDVKINAANTSLRSKYRTAVKNVDIVAGLIYGIAAWIQIGRSSTASMNNATDANLETITAVVIGGTSLFGGRGLLWGSLMGALIVTVFNNGLSLADVDTNYRRLAIGALILVAVALDQWIRKLRK